MKQPAIMKLAVGLIAGIVSVSCLLPAPSSWIPWVILALGTGGLLVRRERLAALAFGLGAVRIVTSPLTPSPHDVAALAGAGTGSRLTAPAEVLAAPVRPGPSQKSQKVVVGVTTGTHSGRVLLTAPASPALRPGDLVTLRGSLERPQRLTGFDYPAWLAKDGIFTVMRPTMVQPAGHRQTLLRLCYGVRESFESKLRQTFPEPAAGFLLGITIGEQSALPDQIVTAFRRTGTSHVLVLSGYNVSVVLAVVLGLLGRQRRVVWLAFVTLGLFVLMVGPTASVLRAATMGSLLLVASLLGRPQSALRACVVTAAAMLLISPWSARYDLGFDLSFLATAGILLFEPPLRARLAWLPATVREPVAVTVAAGLTTAPLIMLTFGYISPVSPLANLLVVPTVPWLMLGAAVTTGISYLSGALAAGLAASLSWVTGGLLNLVGALAEVPFATIDVSPIRPLALGVLLGAGWLWSRRLLRPSEAEIENGL